VAVGAEHAARNAADAHCSANICSTVALVNAHRKIFKSVMNQAPLGFI